MRRAWAGEGSSPQPGEVVAFGVSQDEDTAPSNCACMSLYHHLLSMRCFDRRIESLMIMITRTNASIYDSYYSRQCLHGTSWSDYFGFFSWLRLAPRWPYDAPTINVFSKVTNATTSGLDFFGSHPNLSLPVLQSQSWARTKYPVQKGPHKKRKMRTQPSSQLPSPS